MHTLPRTNLASHVAMVAEPPQTHITRKEVDRRYLEGTDSGVDSVGTRMLQGLLPLRQALKSTILPESAIVLGRTEVAQVGIWWWVSGHRSLLPARTLPAPFVSSSREVKRSGVCFLDKEGS